MLGNGLDRESHDRHRTSATARPLVARDHVDTGVRLGPSQRPGERFTRTRLRPGYRIEDVDDLLSRADAGTLTARDVTTATFGSTRGIEGYDEREVDATLDALVARLRAEGDASREPDRSERPWWARLFGGRDDA
jgi:DivIVA domain-containing protein